MTTQDTLFALQDYQVATKQGSVEQEFAQDTASSNQKPLIYIIEDDFAMATCLQLAIGSNIQSKVFADAITAMNALNEHLPDLILLDVLLTGPNGFTFLNELASYTDTAKIPVFLITSLPIKLADVEIYGVKQVFDKATMTPQIIQQEISQILEQP